MSNENRVIPKSEHSEAKGFQKWFYEGMSWLGLTSGIGLVAWGGWWFIWSMIQFFIVKPESAFQQMIQENYFNQAQLSAILVALGVLIMEIKKLKES